MNEIMDASLRQLQQDGFDFGVNVLEDFEFFLDFGAFSLDFCQ